MADLVPMPESESGGEASGVIEASEVRAALARLVAAPALRNAPQLAAFLGFVVERRLEGRENEIKGYTIAVEALGRPSDFDPQIDPIVRVEAGRLRKALDLYYGGEGATDTIRIAIPRGSYVPVFSRFEESGSAGVEGEAAPAESASTVSGSDASPPAIVPSRPAVPRRSLIPMIVLLAFAFAATAAALWRLAPSVSIVLDQPPPVAVDRLFQEAARVSVSTASAHLPVLAVGVIEGTSDPRLSGYAGTFARQLVDAIARFDDLIIARAPVVGSPAAEGATYLLELGANREGEQAFGSARLKAAGDGRIVWAGAIERDLSRGIDETELRELARRRAILLAQPFGIIHADLRLQTATPEMACVFLALNYRRNLRSEDHLVARDCLEMLLERDPGFHPAWSQLALITLDEYRLGYNARPEPPLDRALSAALVAVRLAPASARAHQALMAALFAKGQTDEALDTGREALARNPNDPDVMAELGARFVMLNRPEEALPLLREAVELSAGRPASYDFHLFLAEFLTGRFAKAQAKASFFGADETVLSLIGRAILHGAEQNRSAAGAVLTRLVRAEPRMRSDPAGYLARLGFTEPVARRILAELRRAGLDAVDPDARP